MPLIVVPMGLEVLNFALVWISGSTFDFTTKILLAIGIVIKFACYFVAAIILDDGEPRKRNVLISMCALVNGALVAFSILANSFTLLINNAVLLVLLVVWSCLTVFDIRWTWGKKE